MIHEKLEQSQKKMMLSIGLVGTILIAKLGVAFLTNSLALFSDSWHLITDLTALVISWWGLRISTKKANPKNTFGYYRYSVLTALINNVSLITISLFIFYKAIDRYFHPVTVEPKGMIVIAIFGLIINLTIVLNLKSNNQNLNVKSAFLHFVGDALADVGVLVGGVIIIFTGWSGIDTLLSAFLACIILRSATKMSVECVKIFLETTPNTISIDGLKNSIQSIKNIRGVTDIHVWSLSAEVIALTAHVWIENQYFKNQEYLLHNLQHLLHEEFGIEHSTIQFETAPCQSCFHSKQDHDKSCSLCIDSCPATANPLLEGIN